ncbi:MAG: hypothetical protein ABEJ04_05875 [Halobacteriaceae archaeon]
MTVVLAGVAADGGNVHPVPERGADGRFEYVPIPESEPTTETATYGSLPRRHGDGALDSLLSYVQPGSDPDRRTRPVGDVPVHRDPNFEHLTYGEPRRGYVERLAALEPGDVVAFYGGLREGERKHRYLLGYFTVREAVDFRGLSAAEREAAFEAHPENAHAKRHFAGADTRDRLVVVDGTDPAALFERTTARLSTFDRFGNSQYYLDDAFADRFRVRSPDHAPGDPVWLGFKPAVECALSAAAFRERLPDGTF